MYFIVAKNIDLMLNSLITKVIGTGYLISI